MAIGHGSEMRVKRPLCCIQKHRIRSCRSKPKLSSQFKRTSSVSDIVEGCFQNTSPPFEIEFVWVCYVVVNLLWICFCSSIWTNAGFLYSVAAVIWSHCPTYLLFVHSWNSSLYDVGNHQTITKIVT